ncbi:hypothetical protein N0V90_002335 [Kalmusia sp. IMI 367209]|nr:hypothetical protein N0V90_002335 [Kalmusia sp. IMI 367209]
MFSQHFIEKGFMSDVAWVAAQAKELEELRKMVNDENSLRHASRLNQGLDCHLDPTDPPGKSLMGGVHIHLRIQFANDTVWLARILRYNFMSFADDLTNDTLRSECATLKSLESKRIPTPRLHMYGQRNDLTNDVGVAYMLINELPGRPFNQLHASEAQLNKVYSQLADILSDLSKHPFDRIGSLTLSTSGGIIVGPVTGGRTGTLAKLGIFNNAAHYYSAWAEEYQRMAVNGQLFARYLVNAYLVFKELAELARAGKYNPFEQDLDAGDHILVDENCNITEIIDWSFARIVPSYDAFGPSLVTANMDDILKGKTGLSGNDKLLGRMLRHRDSDIARFANSQDKCRRCMFGLGMGMNLTWYEAVDIFKGILITFGEASEDMDWETWKTHALERWADDEDLRILVKTSANKNFK